MGGGGVRGRRHRVLQAFNRLGPRWSGAITYAPQTQQVGFLSAFSCSLLVVWLLRMHDGLPYGVHGGHRLRRSTWEKETEGRPQDLPEKLEAFYPPCVGGPERETGAWAGSLRISARGRPDAMTARRERVLGPLWLPPPFSFCRLRFTFECAD